MGKLVISPTLLGSVFLCALQFAGDVLPVLCPQEPEQLAYSGVQVRPTVFFKDCTSFELVMFPVNLGVSPELHLNNS